MTEPRDVPLPEIDLDAVAGALAREFPDAGEIAPCSILGWGFGSVVVETAGGVVFRVARIPGIHEGFEWQRAFLEVVAPRLHVAVPQPRWLIGPAPGLTHGAVGYPKLAGQIMTEPQFYVADQRALAADLARLAADLHAIPPEGAPMLRTVTPEQRMERERPCRDDVTPVMAAHFTPEEYALAEAWWDRYMTDDRILSYEPRVTHGDLWWANFLVDTSGSRLLGVLDWELAVIGDPARDFAGLAYLGVDFLDRVLDEYERITGGADPALRYRTPLVFQVREFHGLRYAAQYPQHREMDDALAKVRRVIGAAT
jgi:aminoglycoside phosphotransferase (APT) family kinase protein